MLGDVPALLLVAAVLGALTYSGGVPDRSRRAETA